MLIFNAVLIYLSPTFSIQNVAPSENSSAVDISTEYGHISPDITNPFVLLFGSGVGVSGLFSGLGVFISGLLAIGGVGALILLKNYILAGALFFSAFLVFLFNATKNVITVITNSSGNLIVDSIFTLITICISIIAVFVIIDMFAPGGTTA